MLIEKLLNSIEENECILCTDFASNQFVLSKEDKTITKNNEEHVVVKGTVDQMEVPSKFIITAKIMPMEMFIIKHMIPKEEGSIEIID